MMTEQLMYLLSNMFTVISGSVCLAVGCLLLFYYGKAWLAADGRAAWQCVAAVIAGLIVLVSGVFILAV